MNHSTHHHDHQESGKNSHSMNHENMVSDFKKRFFVSLFLSIPIVLLSPVGEKVFGFPFYFLGDKYVLFVFSSAIFFYGGKPFLLGLKKEFQEKAFGMMTLVSLAIFVSYFFSSLVVFGFDGQLFFLELDTLILVMLLGHWIEMRSVMGASRALEKLSELIPDEASLKKGKETVIVKTSELKKGDTVLVRPGERIPVDGIILKGQSAVDEAAFTGESVPIFKRENHRVIGGSINGEGPLEVRLEKKQDEFYVSRMVEMVKKIESLKSRTQLLADKAAFYLTIVAIFSGVATFFVWLILLGDLEFAVERTATVLVIACPHALGLAIPLVISISTTLSSQNGLLIRNRDALENARKITMVVFDKTGTLTQGKFEVEKIRTFFHEVDSDELLRVVASLENGSEHPIANAIMKEAKKRKIELGDVNNFKVLRGKGVEGMMDGKNIFAISSDYLKDFSVEVPDEIKDEGGTVISVLERNDSETRLLGYIIVSDQIRDESFGAIEFLKKEGIKTWMLSGDNEKVAKGVSEKLEMDGFFASVLPHQKQEKIKELQDRGEFVAMVGDGVNDAPAIAQADIGIAIGEGTDIAAETSDVILVKNNPRDVLKFISFGKKVYAKMIQNLVWATGYNVIAIPLAAGVFFGSGFVLSPALGALIMSLSTVAVAVNARTLTWNK
ncbi:MAG: heavy metal translocating P-type ATPase [Candidatus Moranbacteria bacterium]|nr:heavy metal translocating P-type ATPase [Candidatus Moranbacteria bacterium]